MRIRVCARKSRDRFSGHVFSGYVILIHCLNFVLFRFHSANRKCHVWLRLQMFISTVDRTRSRDEKCLQNRFLKPTFNVVKCYFIIPPFSPAPLRLGIRCLFGRRHGNGNWSDVFLKFHPHSARLSRTRRKDFDTILSLRRGWRFIRFVELIKLLDCK